ncbi:hypothetical protein E4U55_001771 [Claviceps digitariae]|nr:hypothetical protein E4U55_001771 [Claviceps digitariae]
MELLPRGDAYELFAEGSFFAKNEIVFCHCSLLGPARNTDQTSQNVDTPAEAIWALLGSRDAMASITSHTSPHSLPYEFDSRTDDESWQYLDYSSGASAPGSVVFLPSPASGSLNGYAIVGHAHLTPPQASVSPLSLGDTMFLPGGSTITGQSAQSGDHLFTSGLGGTDGNSAGLLGMASSSGGVPFATPEDYIFSGMEEINDMMPFMATFDADLFSPSLSSLNQSAGSVGPQTQSGSVQDDMTMPSWDANGHNVIFEQMMSFGDLTPSPQLSHYTPSTSSVSSPPRPPPPGKLEAYFSSSPSSSSSSALPSASSTSPLPIPRVKNGRVEKRKTELSSGKFVIMTPNSIHAQAGRPNPFECFEAMRATHRGRKGPLPDETKQDALEVRRLGACFCCHSRKVKCDKQRPCKHCKRLMLHVPQAVCWQFQDFNPVLFPDFIRAHFKKEAMAAFLRDNVDGWFSGGGMEQQQQQRQQLCEVELFSGPRFSAVLRVKAKFFTPKSCDVLQHWHLNPAMGRAHIRASGSAPIGVEFNTAAQRDDLRKRAKTYVQDILREPYFAEQVTDSLKSTQLPLKILRIVQTYAKQSDSPLVKRALTVYAMHYIMTRHLCLTHTSILTLQSSGLVPQNTPWLTPRVLARQIKSLIDELIMREMDHIFDAFSKALKSKHRREWAPCTAAFLILCLFMEAVETTAENFALAQNEIQRRNTSPPEYARDFALNVCRELENLPFKQFAYQFHTIFQTHDRDANTKSFNPLFDDGFMERGELDGPAADMVRRMRELFYGEDWQDLQFLAHDESILHRHEHAHPIESSVLYTGRLVAKFLLSFMNEDIIFGGQI